MRIKVMKQRRTFIDPVVGNCEYKSFFVVNDLYGGYSANCERGSIAADFVNASTIVNLAKEAGMKVMLSGGSWQLVGKTGYGEEVSPEEAESLIMKLKSLQTSSKVYPSG